MGNLDMSDLVPRLQRHRASLSVSYDVAIWLVAYLAFGWLRLDGGVTAAVPWAEIGLVGLATATLYVALASCVRLHQGRAKTASLEEMLLLGTVMMSAGLAVFAVNLWF